MANPGLTFDGQLVNGIVEEIEWGTWDIDQMEFHAVGVEGVSVIEGELVSRDFDVPLMLTGYSTQLLRDADVETLEELAGDVGALEIRVGGGTVIFTQAANIKLLGVERGRSGYDATHLHFRQLLFQFRQLATE